jgi:DNA-binding NarL/FixJ family response regulator
MQSAIPQLATKHSPIGLDILKQLRSERPRLPVLVLSMYSEDQYAMCVLKAGASGYLTKDSAPDELIKAIREVVGGGRTVSPAPPACVM